MFTGFASFSLVFIPLRTAVGWISRRRGKAYRAQLVVNPTAAFLIFHHVYAPTPGIVDLGRVLDEAMWKYLGFPDPDHLKTFFRELERKKLIARYVQVDRLEQVTTQYSLDELLERRMRI